MALRRSLETAEIKVQKGGMTLEVTCRIDGQLVSRGTALVRAPRAAFVYPGQGIH